MTIKNGDMPAMPIEINGFGQFAPEAFIGLTKRETMAMHAMAALIGKTDSVYDFADAAIDAAAYADALLAELERTK